MHVSRLLAIAVLLTMAGGASAQSSVKSAPKSAPHILAMIPGQAQTLMYFPDFKRLEAKWSKVVAPFGGKDSFLNLKRETGIDPSQLGSGPVVRVSFRAPGATETWAWMVPANDPKAVLNGLRATQKVGQKGGQEGGLWAWEARTVTSKKRINAPGPTVLFGTAKAGYLVVALGEADLTAFKKPVNTLSEELAPYTAWMDSHDFSVVATKAAVAEAALAANRSFKPAVAEPKAGAEPVATPSKTDSRLKAKVNRWVEIAKASVHHVLFGLDLSEDGGLAFEARALLIKDSPLSRDLATLSPVAGHPLSGLATSEFAVAFGGEWGMLLDFQSAFFEGLDKGGKVQAATSSKLQKALTTQAGLVRSMAGTFAAPAPRAPLMDGLTSLVRVSDSQAYIAAMEETSQAQNAFLLELEMPGTVFFTSGILPGVPSCSVTTRFGLKDDPATASSRRATATLFGGESFVMSMGALDNHQVLAVMGGPELLKARMEAARKAPEGLAPSIAAVEPDLGRDHRFALYLDPRGMRNLAEVMAGMFGGPDAGTLPAIPEVPAAGLTLSLDPAVVELRGSVRAETLKAMATLFKGVGALLPANRKGNPAPGGESDPKE